MRKEPPFGRNRNIFHICISTTYPQNRETRGRRIQTRDIFLNVAKQNNKMSAFKDLGVKPKEKGRQKKWNVLSQSKREETSTQHDQTLSDNYDKPIKKEINRLEEINKQYENEYLHERKMLLFVVYEYQYLAEAKTNYLNMQHKLMSTINAENSNLVATINMYNNRIKENNDHIITLDQGIKNMEIYISKVREEVAGLMRRIDAMDNHRQETMKHNTDLRLKYMQLLKVNIEKSNNNANRALQHPSGCNSIISIVKEYEQCIICYEKMTSQVFSCRENHPICQTCRPKIGDRCPYCSVVGPITRNRLIETLLRASNESAEKDGKEHTPSNTKRNK